MVEIGVRELKKHLSEYLDRAARGEVVVVTDRGHPKARLGPLSTEERIAQGIREGWITPAKRPPGPLPPSVPLRHPPRMTVQQLMDEDRGE
jgi:prevent-host-death family protein